MNYFLFSILITWQKARWTDRKWGIWALGCVRKTFFMPNISLVGVIIRFGANMPQKKFEPVGQYLGDCTATQSSIAYEFFFPYRPMWYVKIFISVSEKLFQTKVRPKKVFLTHPNEPTMRMHSSAKMKCIRIGPAAAAIPVHLTLLELFYIWGMKESISFCILALSFGIIKFQHLIHLYNYLRGKIFGQIWWEIEIKDTCRKSYVMRPLSGRKSWEQHLIAHSQWWLLRFRIEFLHSVFCVEPTHKFLETYLKRAIIGEFWISVTLTSANAYTLTWAVFRLVKSMMDLLYNKLNNFYTEY